MACRKFTLSVTACVLLLVPVVVPALFVLRISLAADQVGAQELGPKQAYLSGPRPAEAPPSSANQAATNQSAKPAGKMSFIPASPTPRDSSPSAQQRSVANPLARRAVPQPPKYAVAAGAAPDASRTQNRDARSVAARPAKPQPSAVASKTPLRAPVSQQSDRPQQLFERLESPAETLEPVIAATEKPLPRTLEEPTFEEPLPEKGSGRGVVQLFFEDEPADEESNETMDVDEAPATIPQRDEIRHVAAQGDTAKAQEAGDSDDVKEMKKRELMKRKLMTRILADLTPVGKIKLGDAVKLPKLPDPKDKDREEDIPEPNEMTALAMRLTNLGEDDSKNLVEPSDTALAMLRLRKSFNVFAISRDPWQANRDSYPFHHNPLWFEDPNLERCGRGWGPFTTTVSAMRASANIPILPYRFTAEKPWTCVRTLPDCTTCEKFGVAAYLPPWSLSAAAVQAAATVGIIYIVP